MSERQLSVLLATTTWWPSPARLAMAFGRLGLRVAALYPTGHPLRHTRAVAHHLHYSPFRPLAAWLRAIDAAEPTLIVPCDDRAVQHLHALHDASPQHRTLISSSWGNASSFSVVASRDRLLRVAADLGVRVPAWRPVRCIADLTSWNETLPWVIKSGMSWGGAGVQIVQTRSEAIAAFQAMARRVGIGRAVKRLIINGDGFSLAPSLARAVPEVIAQRFIAGQPASTTMVCANGAMVAQLSVRALDTQGPTGASTAVEAIDHPKMAEAAALLAAHLELSGFHGLDFVLDDKGHAWLIEFNPRATQVGHLADRGRASLAQALVAAMSGGIVPRVPVMAPGSRIAFFPQAWRRDPNAAWLRTPSHDVPWDEPELARELMAPPWPNRGRLAMLWQRLFDPHVANDYWAGAAADAATTHEESELFVSGGEARPKRRLSA